MIYWHLLTSVEEEQWQFYWLDCVFSFESLGDKGIILQLSQWIELKALFWSPKVTYQYAQRTSLISSHYKMLSEWKLTVQVSSHKEEMQSSEAQMLLLLWPGSSNASWENNDWTAGKLCSIFLLLWGVLLTFTLAQYLKSNSACSHWQNVGFVRKM